MHSARAIPQLAGGEGGVIAVLRHLTGKVRSHSSWITGGDHVLSIGPGGRIGVHPGTSPPPGKRALATLTFFDGTYRVEAAGDAPLWVNRRSVRQAELVHGDIIEFGDEGPISRFERVDDAHEPALGLAEIADDAYAYIRCSRRPVTQRVPRAMSGALDQFLHRTTLPFRAGVLVLLAIVAGAAVWQWQRLERLEGEIAFGEAELARVAEALGETRSLALQASDLSQLRDELSSRIETTDARLGTLERHWKAGGRVIAEATPSIIFIEGAFVFRDPASGRLLRQVVAADGRPVLTPFGRPLLSLDGDGPPAMREYTGTGILVEGTDAILTNRHIGLPWENDAASAVALTQGLKPEMLHLRVYFPGEANAGTARLRRVSDEADLALLETEADMAGRPRLRLATSSAAIGDQVIVIGYATGLRSMLAQAGQRFIDTLTDTPLDAGEIAARLAAAGHVRPLASRGIIGQATPAAVVFDADTTHGGSGGPVLSLEGEVIALQSAIVPGYGGSNLGVPASAVRRFLETAKGH